MRNFYVLTCLLLFVTLLSGCNESFDMDNNTTEFSEVYENTTSGDKWNVSLTVPGDKVHTISIDASVNMKEVPDEVYRVQLSSVKLDDAYFIDLTKKLFDNEVTAQGDTGEKVYLGTVDSIPYTLTTGQYGFSLEPEKYIDVISDEAKAAGKMMYPLHSYYTLDNHCKMTATDAKKVAAEYLIKMGYDEYKITGCANLVWETVENEQETGVKVELVENDEQDLWCEGYFLTFSRDIHGCAQDTNPYFYDSNESNVRDLCYNTDLEQIYIEVTDKGVISFSAYQLCTVSETVYQAEDIISIVDAKAKLEKALADNPDEYADEALAGVLNYTNLEFVYYASSSNEIIPVWKLSLLAESEQDSLYPHKYRQVVLINAIDGTVVNPSESYFSNRLY